MRARRALAALLLAASVGALPAPPAAAGVDCRRPAYNFYGVSDLPGSQPPRRLIFITEHAFGVSRIDGIPGPNRQLKAIDSLPGGPHLIATSSGIYRLNTLSDHASLVSSVPVRYKAGADVGPDGIFRSVDIQNRLISYDIRGGTLEVGDTVHFAADDVHAAEEPRLSSIASMPTDDGLVLLGIEAGLPDGPGRLVSVAPADGELRTIAENPALNDLTNGFDIAPDGCGYYSDGEAIYTIDLATAALIRVRSIGTRVAGISVWVR